MFRPIAAIIKVSSESSYSLVFLLSTEPTAKAHQQ